MLMLRPLRAGLTCPATALVVLRPTLECSVFVCVLGGGWGPPPPTTDLCHDRDDPATHTWKSRRKSQHSGQYDFCGKLFPYCAAFFWAPKGALGADTIRGFGAPRIALGRHFRAIY